MTDPEKPEVDPLEHLIGQGDGDRKDPFAAMLDELLAAEGRSIAEEIIKNPENEDHEWEEDRAVLYGSDAYVMTCRKCFRTMEVGRSETLGQAMQRHTIAADCSLQVAAEVMGS